MFRRRTSPSGDVVAAAQRRLAALAAQHTAHESSPGNRATHRESEVSAEVPDPEPLAPEPVFVARHLGPRRTELGRWGVSAQHVTVAALLVLGLVVAVAWWALRSVPHAEPVQMSTARYLPTQTPGLPPSTADPSPSSSAGGAAGGGPGPSAGSARLVIDVAGKVRHPGIVELAAGSRVIDAIAAAGGARPGVSLTSLNLARLLVDGEQIVVGIDVPGVGGSGSPASTGATTGAIAAVNLNTATAEQLETLPDVGPVTAQAILQWRTDNGPFASVDDLLDVSGIGTATLADIRPYVYV